MKQEQRSSRTLLMQLIRLYVILVMRDLMVFYAFRIVTRIVDTDGLHFDVRCTNTQVGSCETLSAN